LAIVELRRRRLTQARITRSLAVSDSTDLVHLDTMNRPGFFRRSPGLSQTAIGSWLVGW